MKSDETLVRLSQNPFYKMSDEEAKRLKTISKEKKTSSVSEDSKKKEATVTRGNATVKETGKLSKHDNDPVKE